MTEDLIVATIETVQMVGASIFWTILFGLPLGVVLYASGPQGTRPRPATHRVLGVIVNIGRSAPFVILMVAITPFTRLLVGTTIGSAAAIVPLAVAAIPFFARLVESALVSVDPGLIEAADSMGATHSGIVRRVLIPEAMPGLIRGLTVTLVAVTGYSAMAGAIGGGGLGDLAIRYGYQRYRTDYMIATVVLLVVLVQIFQFIGDRTARRLDHR
ncbi:methionine ABC transporter permease [Stackebrandtia nassauensis]|uniref:Binding-protein-dependent transport systems inner membrane component n=1 Tax=Stackebrandtia nassauensis (strain DSM 44728 / CIP 108903 / NRRL B-16338 / NBRC 102104 / LLR-40K-21) TaxID=446470 RepID=D3PYA3_STANL|nr:methionine ABC transporter permease [Stackebrandtia nassauensis]ADD41470.1 binding-protein-dependent transport systems inner membrane component [Stackebrandtia nassauensis DSM 44728]